MSILSRVNATAPATSAPAVTLPSVTPVNTPAAVGVQLTLGTQPSSPSAGPSGLSMLEALEAEEAAAQPAAHNGPQLTQEIVNAISVIAVTDMGYPKNTGEAAALFAAYGAMCSPPRTYSADGAGRLAGLNVFATAADILKLAEDLKAHAAKKAAQAAQHATPAPAPVAAPVAQPAPAVAAAHPTTTHVAPIGILSNEAPPSNPALAALPVEGMAPPAAQTQMPLALPNNVATSATPVTTAMVQTAPVAEQKTEAPAATEQPKADEPKAKTKTPKNPNKAEPRKAKTGDEFELYVNCIPSKPYESLDAYVAQWCKTLVGFFYDKEKDLPDVRCIVSDNRMNFGKWPGPLAALVREVMAEGKLPRGVYVIDTRDNTINAEIANAMISARNDDGTSLLDYYVKGI